MSTPERIRADCRRDEQIKDEAALAQTVAYFARRWRPSGSDVRDEAYREEFEHELNAMIYRAMAVARQPLEKAVADAYARVPLGAILG